MVFLLKLFANIVKARCRERGAVANQAHTARDLVKATSDAKSWRDPIRPNDVDRLRRQVASLKRRGAIRQTIASWRAHGDFTVKQGPTIKLSSETADIRLFKHLTTVAATMGRKANDLTSGFNKLMR